MQICVVVLAMFALTTAATAQGPGLPEVARPVSVRLAALQNAVTTGNDDALAEFWSSVEGRGPLIEIVPGASDELLVSFLWRGDDTTRAVHLYGGLPAARYYPWSKAMARLPDSDVWYRTERIPTDARFQYAFTVNAPEVDFLSEADLLAYSARYPRQPDPLNPNRFDGQSYVELGDAPQQPFVQLMAGVSQGTVRRDSLFSTELLEWRHFTTYLPASFQPSGPPYPLMIQFDGEWWVGDGHSLPVVLDNLIGSGNIPPLVAVLVDNQGVRDRDLPNSAAFADFVAEELIPWLRERLPLVAEPSRVIVSGASNGGLAAGYAALRHPGVYGNVLSIAGWWDHAEENYATNFFVTPTYRFEPRWIIREYASRPRLPVRFYLSVGRFDVYYGNALSMNRHMRDVLVAKAYPLEYREYNSGHDGIAMRGDIADGLLALTAEWR